MPAKSTRKRKTTRRPREVLTILRTIAPFLFKRTAAPRTASVRAHASSRTAAKHRRARPSTATSTRSKARPKTASKHTRTKSKKPSRAPVTQVHVTRTSSPATHAARTRVSTRPPTTSVPMPVEQAPLPAKRSPSRDSHRIVPVFTQIGTAEADGSVEVLKAALQHERGWMEHVRSVKKRLDQPIHPASAWSMLRGRLGRSTQAADASAKDDTPVAQANDRLVHRMKSSVPEVEIPEQTAPAAKKSGRRGLFHFSRHRAEATSQVSDAAPASDDSSSIPSASKEPIATLSAAELRKEAAEAKDATKRLEREFAQMRKEQSKQRSILRSARIAPTETHNAGQPHPEPQQDAAAPTPPPEQQIETTIHRSKPKVKRAGMFRQIAASIGYVGLGKERIHFVQNMATMLNAGLPLIDALKTLIKETRAKPMKKLIQRILDAVENGSALWRAMDAQNFFSLHAIALVRIGEEAGNLAENMGYLAEQEEKDNALKSKVKMAMIYPTIVMVLMFIIIMVLGMFVLPNLIGVLFSLNVELPLVTRIIVKITNLFTTYGAVGIPSMIAGFFVLVILAKFTPLKVVFQWIMFHIPGIGRLAREATIARFGVILGGLLRAGVPIIDALQSLVEVTPIVVYRRFYTRLLDHITVGDSFARSFERIKHSNKLLPPSVQQLVITGEKSGALADIMLKVADIYDKKAAGTAEKLPVILEPMLLLFIGALVGTIAFAIIVPIYSIVGSVSK